MPPQDNAIRKWIENYFSVMSSSYHSRSVLEIGCFPGKFLSVFGELGYELNGIDISPRVETDLPIWLRDKGYKTGNFINADFFDYADSRKYGVVCSFGFIEHFVNWQEAGSHS